MKSFIRSMILCLLWTFAYSLNESSVGFATTQTDYLKDHFFNNVQKMNDPDQPLNLCQIQLAYLSKNYKTLKLFPMIDSWGKIPAGIMLGNIFSIGNYYECVNFKRTFPYPIETMEGQYCKTFLQISGGNKMSRKPNVFGLNSNNFETVFGTENREENILPLGAGICIPKSCDSRAVKKYFKDSGAPVIIIGCQTADPPKWKAIDYVTVSILSIIAILLTAGTAYDYLHKTPNPNQFLMAFSVPSNLNKIFTFSKTKNANNIDCLTGIRAISMIWVLYGHTLGMLVFTPQINYVDLFKFIKTFPSIFFHTAFISVDTFFFMSGLLTIWVGLPEIEKRKGKLNVPLMYLHRYLRLTPMLGFVILFVLGIIKFFGSGPLWPMFVKIAAFNCEENWWQDLLYIQNYAVNKNICLGHSWYLAIDFQLFLISPLILYGFWKWGKKMIPVLAVLVALSVGCLYGTYYSKGYKGALTLNDSSDRQNTTYIFTHTRYPIWMIGMAFGYLLLQTKGKQVKIPWYSQLLGWIVSFGILLGVVIAPYSTITSETYEPTSLDGASYEAFSKIGWGIMLSWIAFCCYHGYGGVINSFLSNPLWQPLARLSFAMYLCHLTVMAVVQGNLQTPTHFSNFDLATKFWSLFGITFLSAIVLVLAIESPLIGLEKMLFRKPKKDQ